MIRAALAFAALALPAAAQDNVVNGSGAVLRVLDKLNGTVQDIEVANADIRGVERIEVALTECRYPGGNAAGEAFAFLTVREAGIAEPVFRGWMIASSPALNPMEHPRYDVWVLRCTTS